MASFPNASLKGVSLVGVWAIVLYAHEMLGSLFGHISFAPSRRILIIFSMDQFVTFDLSIGLCVGGKKVVIFYP